LDTEPQRSRMKEPTDVTRLQTEHIATSSAPLGWSGFGLDLRDHQRPSSATFPHGFRQVIVALHLTSPGEFRLDDGRHDHVGHDLPTSLTFIPARIPCALSWSRPCTTLHLRFDPDFLEGVWSEIDGSPVNTADLTAYVGPVEDRLVRLGKDLLAEVREPGIGGRLFAETLAQQAAVLIRRQFVSGPSDSTQAIPPQASMGIRRVKAFMREELGRDLTLEELARVAGLSRFHFIREFRRATGESPHRYLMNLRVLRAEALLRTKGRTVSLAQVAADTGFFDQSHLTRHFRRTLGTTPAALLK
jgi:AraC family transcriptional regulator